jgi:hypothetical protein
VAYLGSGSLNWASDGWLLVSEDAHMTPKSTARHKYPLLWIADELSLLRTRESRDSLVPSEVCELLFWMHPLYSLCLFALFFSQGNSEKSSICSSSDSLTALILSKWMFSNLSRWIRCSCSYLLRRDRASFA